MIELRDETLRFSFPEVHPQATLEIEFQRTLRIPDDDSDYPLPPGLGAFPLRHVDDFAANVPERWMKHGGVMLPMYQSEAMWLNFNTRWIDDRDAEYPFAIKISAGKVDAVTGEPYSDELNGAPQNYVVVPEQPWLDGYCVEKGIIRQFVAMPLGSGYSAEKQITGKAEHGGLQIAVMPMRREIFERRFPKVDPRRMGYADICACACESPACAGPDMGLAAGGRMRQEICEDPYDLSDWDDTQRSRCFVHIANSLVWRSITGQNPPTVPPTAKAYARAGLPWFAYYDDKTTAVKGSAILNKVKSVATLGKEKGDAPLPENESVAPDKVVVLRRGMKEGQVREGKF